MGEAATERIVRTACQRYGQRLFVVVPVVLMHILGLMVHCERMGRKGSHVNLFPSLLTLLLHFVFAMVMTKDSEPEAMRFSVTYSTYL